MLSSLDIRKRLELGWQLESLSLSKWKEVCNAQYTPPTPTQLDSFVASAVCTGLKNGIELARAELVS